MKLLSERLIAFRDSEGQLGLIDEFCAHRGVSLWFGRNEECGLRCPYHGWKFDATGQCVEVPSEPVESGFAKKIKLTSYPLVERGGVLWTYMGPPEQQPPLPEWEFSTVPREQTLHLQAPAGMQLAAGDGGRHRFEPRLLPAPRRPQLRSAVQGRRRATSTISATRSRCSKWSRAPAASIIGARRNAENDNYYWRITHWVMPCFTMIPPRGDHPMHGHFWVPIDDENCWAWSYDYHPVRALTDAEVRGHARRQGRPLQVRARHLSGRSPTRTTTI